MSMLQRKHQTDLQPIHSFNNVSLGLFLVCSGRGTVAKEKGGWFRVGKSATDTLSKGFLLDSDCKPQA